MIGADKVMPGARWFTVPPSLEELTRLAEAELATVPACFTRRLSDVGIMVEERADAATLSRMRIRSPWHLLGLYHGRSLLGRSFLDPTRMPDRIFLYRQPILLWWVRMRLDLALLVRHVLVHEIAHHFGFTDAGIAAIERQAWEDPESGPPP
ncbi:MAG: metallopeptidase family protein [Acetobacteraceae bacterium]